MKIWIFEDNLIWSARLAMSIKALGHEPAVLSSVPSRETAQAAIVNLSSLAFKDLVQTLNQMNVYTIGHAGHKEKELLKLGVEAGCNRIVTNSELTHKLPSILSEVPREEGC